MVLKVGQNSHSITEQVSATPGALLAIVGFGLFLLTIEATRTPAVQTVYEARRPGFSSVLALIFLLVVAILLRKKLDTLPSRPMLVVGVAILISVSQFFTIVRPDIGQNVWVVGISEVVFALSGAFFFYYWIRVLYPLGAKRMAVIFAFALIVLAAANGMTALFKAEAARGILAMLPILSAFCWCYYRDYSQSHGGTAPSAEGDGTEALVLDESLRSPHDADLKASRVSMGIKALTLFCCTFIFGYIHIQWIQFQDGTTLSLLMHLGIALGEGLAGLCVLLLVRFLWSRRSIEMFTVFLVPLILMALWLTAFSSEAWIVLYLILLNMSQKLLLFFFVLMAPFLIRNPSTLWPWLVTYLATAMGITVSSVAAALASEALLSTCSVLAMILIVICTCISAFRSSGILLAQQEADEDEPRDNADAQPVRTNRFAAACQSLAQQYRLTEREQEILVLLARGKTAQAISETLVIAPMTAKAHIRNIYAKMDVHRQQDIIAMVEQEIDSNL